MADVLRGWLVLAGLCAVAAYGCNDNEDRAVVKGQAGESASGRSGAGGDTSTGDQTSAGGDAWGAPDQGGAGGDASTDAEAGAGGDPRGTPDQGGAGGDVGERETCGPYPLESLCGEMNCPTRMDSLDPEMCLQAAGGTGLYLSTTQCGGYALQQGEAPHTLVYYYDAEGVLNGVYFAHLGALEDCEEGGVAYATAWGETDCPYVGPREQLCPLIGEGGAGGTGAGGEQ
jgi:hypothetical protein